MRFSHHLNENTIGKQHPYYAMGPRARITSEPLVDYFEEYFDSPVLSLEQVLIEHDTVAENELYFAVDGHWTAEAHEIIGRSLSVYLENDSRSPTE